MRIFLFCRTLFFIFALGICAAVGYAQVYPAGSSQHEQRLAHRRYARAQEGHSLWTGYTQWLKETQTKLNMQAGVDISYTFQRVAPSGKQTAVQGVYYPFIQWNILPGGNWGEGVINANYTLVHYWGLEAAPLQQRIGAAAGINDGAAGAETFSQLTYTHTLPGRFNWMSVTLGQFSIGNFDSTSYLGNQQTSLMNASFAQNLSSIYPSASVGAYAQASYAGWSLAAGYQDAANLSGQNLRLNQAFNGKYTFFTALNYTLKNGGFYNLLYYHQSGVQGQPASAGGVSLSLQQPLAQKALVFARANYSGGDAALISHSFAAGAGWKDPLGRNEQDVILLGAAWNRLNKNAWNIPPAREQETVFELQWVWNITPWISLTPDVQLYPKTAQKGRRFASAAGLRTTIML